MMNDLNTEQEFLILPMKTVTSNCKRRHIQLLKYQHERTGH